MDESRDVLDRRVLLLHCYNCDVIYWSRISTKSGLSIFLLLKQSSTHSCIFP